MNRGLSGPLAGTRGPMKLWHLARRVYHEALYQGSLSAAGSSTQRLVEKLSKDSRYITRQARMIQILGSFYLLIVTVLPASTMAELAGGQTHQWNMFVASIAGTIHMLVQTGYLMILTLVATSEILAPDLYRWPESLPIRAEQAGLLRVMALAREFLLPLAVIVFSYPIAAGISGGVPVALATLVVSVFHAALTLSITVLASWRLRRALRSASGGDRRATTVRVLTMAGYGIGIVLVLAVMQFGTGFVMSLLDHPRLGSATSLSLLRVFSLLPLPTSAATLVSSLVARHSALPMTLPLWMPLAGTSMYGVGALLLLKSAWRMIGRREADATQLRTFRRPLRQARDPRPATRLIVRTARAAFRRQIFQTPRPLFSIRDTGRSVGGADHVGGAARSPGLHSAGDSRGSERLVPGSRAFQTSGGNRYAGGELAAG